MITISQVPRIPIRCDSSVGLLVGVGLAGAHRTPRSAISAEGSCARRRDLSANSAAGHEAACGAEPQQQPDQPAPGRHPQVDLRPPSPRSRTPRSGSTRSPSAPAAAGRRVATGAGRRHGRKSPSSDGREVAAAGGDRVVEHRGLGDPVEPEQPIVVGAVAPGVEVVRPSVRDTAMRVDDPLGELVARGHVVGQPHLAPRRRPPAGGCRTSRSAPPSPDRASTAIRPRRGRLPAASSIFARARSTTSRVIAALPSSRVRSPTTSAAASVGLSAAAAGPGSRRSRAG